MFVVIATKHLHAHHSKNEYDNAQHKGQVSQIADCFAHNRNEQIQRGP